jgi:methyl-accepting chemotaxis protein
MEDQSTGLTLDRALHAHQQWKAKLKQAITNQEVLDVQTIIRDDCCELGKWLLADGRNRYGSKPEFVNLIDKHVDFHHTAGFVAELINAKSLDSALSHLGSGSQFASASMEVRVAITRLKAAVGSD